MNDSQTEHNQKKVDPAKSARRDAARLNRLSNEIETQLVRFQTSNLSINFNVDVTADTVWASQQQIADLFVCSSSSVAEHIQDVMREDELDEETVCRKFRQTGSDGKSDLVKHYDLDIILGVGFRVGSPRAREFRRWANETLRGYIVQGYALNEARLRSDPDAVRDLAVRIRAMRAQEKNVYAAVRECFKASSSDYDANSSVTRSFYARLQDRFLYAITEKTASAVILSRADHRLPNMGLRSTAPTISHAKVGKNYLDKDELRTLHIVCETFLIYAEGKAIRGQTMTMKQLAAKLGELLAANDYPVFADYRDFLSERAKKHAQAEYALWLGQQQKKAS